MADTIPTAWRTVFRPHGGHFGGRPGTVSAMISERWMREDMRTFRIDRIIKASKRTARRLRNRGIPQGFSRVMTIFMVPAMRRANRKDLACLKALLEKSEAA